MEKMQNLSKFRSGYTFRSSALWRIFSAVHELGGGGALVGRSVFILQVIGWTQGVPV